MRVTVRVPATSANLGPGYDSFGLALAVYDEVSAEPSGKGLTIRITGVGHSRLPTDSSHLVVRAAAAAFAELAEPMPGLALECVNAIPHGSGQGSSAAAIVAGILLARTWIPDGERRLDDGAVLALATRLEGHPDNVAPALLGGFTIAWMGDDSRPRAVRLDVHPDVRALLFTAEQACATHTARALLPAAVPHAEAAANAARAGLLVHALTRDPALLLDATMDRLHQGYRSPAMPGSAELLRRLRASGIAAVLSGAGPSVLCLGTRLPDPHSLSAGGFAVREVPLSASGAQVRVA